VAGRLQLKASVLKFFRLELNNDKTFRAFSNQNLSVFLPGVLPLDNLPLVSKQSSLSYFASSF